MKKVLFFSLLIFIMVGFGCDGGDDITIQEAPETQDEIRSCNNPELPVIYCTAGSISYLDPWVVSDYMYGKASAANKQDERCEKYSEILGIYEDSMARLNEGYDPDETKLIFINAMDIIADYNPDWNCPGGCDDV